jgi:hypothetical protein
VLLAAVAAAGISVASNAQAVAWTAPTAVKIVQKDNTASGTNVYTSIQTAINACDGKTPCLVKVMPGTYDQGATSLKLKPFVTVEGAGPENTIVTGANVAVANECDNGVVMMANGSVLRQLTVQNTIANSGTGGVHAVALTFNAVSARAEFVRALSVFPANGVVSTNWSRRIGVCVDGGGDPAATTKTAKAELAHVYVEGNNRGGQGNGVRVNWAATVEVRDSRLVGVSTDDSAYPINSNGSDAGTILVEQSSLESRAGATGDACPLWGGAHHITVLNSRLSLSSLGAYASAIYSMAYLRMMNTVITANVPAWYDVDGTVMIANSQLPSDRTPLQALPGAKLVGNYDESFNPVPNK